MITRKQRKQQNKAIARRKRIAKHRNIQNNNVSSFARQSWRNIWRKLGL